MKRKRRSWISAETLRLIDARQFISTGSEHNKAWLAPTRGVSASLLRNREIQWSQPMEHTAAMGNPRKLFQRIQATGKKALGVSERICETDGSPTYN